KADSNDEEGWTLLPNGNLLTVDASNGTHTETYSPAAGAWSSAGNTPNVLVDGDSELGPQPLSPLGWVLAVGATGATSVYSTGTLSWGLGPSLPVINNQQYDTADGPAATLPNGQILVAASPGDYNAPMHLFLYDGSNFTEIADPPNAPNDSSYY